MSARRVVALRRLGGTEVAPEAAFGVTRSQGEASVVEIRTPNGTSCLVRNVQGPAALAANEVCLNRPARVALRSRCGDWVRCRRVEASVLERVDVSMPWSVGRDMVGSIDRYERSAHEYLELHGALLSEGAVVFVKARGLADGLPVPLRVAAVVPGPGMLGPGTRVCIHVGEGTAGMASDISLTELGGVEEGIEAVRELVLKPLRQPGIYTSLGITPVRGVLFTGPPGVGKTLLARAAAGEAQAQVFYVNGPDVANRPTSEAEGELRRIFAEGSRNSPCLIVIDELDALAPRRGESLRGSDARMVGQLLGLMDGLRQHSGVVVIGTTNRPDSIDPALRRPGRFEREVPITMPDIQARIQVLDVLSRDLRTAPGFEESVEWVAKHTEGWTPADLAGIVRTATLAHVDRWSANQDGRVGICKEDLVEAYKLTAPAALRDVGGYRPSSETTKGFSSGKLPTLIGTLVDIAAAAWRKPHSGVETVCVAGFPIEIVHGIAETCALELAANVIPIHLSRLLSRWVGESERRIEDVFDVARRAGPTVLVLHGVDTLIPSSQGRRDSPVEFATVGAELVRQLRYRPPNTKLFVIGVASDQVDRGWAYGSGFDHLLIASRPDSATVVALIASLVPNLHLKDLSLEDSWRAAAEIADGLEWHSLVSFSRRLGLLACEKRSIQVEDLSRLLDEIRGGEGEGV